MKQVTPITTDSEAKILVEMTPQEYLDLLAKNHDQKPRNVVKGLKGLMELFGCSRSKAFTISHADWFRPAVIIRDGKYVSFDEDIALELAAKNSEI